MITILAINQSNSLFIKQVTTYDLYTKVNNFLNSLQVSNWEGTQYPCIYDTAYLSTITNTQGDHVFPNTLKFIIKNQNHNSSWGNKQILADQILNTLASTFALKNSKKSSNHIFKKKYDLGINFLLNNFDDIKNDSYFTAAFEFISTNLIQKINAIDNESSLDPLMSSQSYKFLEKMKYKKLSKLPLDMLSKVKTPFLFALESLDQYDLQQNFDHFVESNGSIATSPSATAYYLTNNPDSTKKLDMLNYLDKYVNKDGGIQSFADYRLMNIPFVLFPLTKAGIMNKSYKKVLEQLLLPYWTKQGIGHSSYFPVADADDTAVSLYLLNKYSIIDSKSKLFDSIKYYSKDDYYVTYPFEIGASNMVNLHVLDMYLETNLINKDEEVDKLLTHIEAQLQKIDGIGGDKYHYSPYCQNAHAVLALTKSFPEQARILIDWFIENQHEDGKWGFNGIVTVEETAYAVLALCYYHKYAEKLDLSILRNAIEYLVTNNEPYQDLWLSKTAYTPIETVEAHITAALALYSKIPF